MKIKGTILIAIIMIVCSCSKPPETKILKNVNLVYEYSDNLREENFQIVITDKKWILNVIKNNENIYTNEEPVNKILKIIDENADEKILNKYIINTENFSHFMVTEYFDKVIIQTDGYVEKYDDPNKERSYNWMGEKIYAIKK